MKWKQTTEEQVEAELKNAQRHAREVLVSLPAATRTWAYTLYSAATTDRLFDWYDARPGDERRRYSETWRPVLEDVWSHLAGDDTAYARISRALGEFYLSAYSNNGDGPDDLDQDEAAAAYYTANCLVHGLVDFALFAASRATDHIDTDWYGRDEARRQVEIGNEIRRQASDLEVIAAAARSSRLRDAVPPELVEALRR